MPVAYTAVDRFSPDRDDWRKFIDFSGLTHLREVISLDSILCPSVVQKLTDEDWQHNVHEDFKTHLFRDLDYLLRRVGDVEQVNVLAVMQEPTTEALRSFTDPRFVFRGFDLTDSSISALVNCGGFDKAFANTDLSEFGLLAETKKSSVRSPHKSQILTRTCLSLGLMRLGVDREICAASFGTLGANPTNGQSDVRHHLSGSRCL